MPRQALSRGGRTTLERLGQRMSHPRCGLNAMAVVSGLFAAGLVLNAPMARATKLSMLPGISATARVRAHGTLQPDPVIAGATDAMVGRSEPAPPVCCNAVIGTAPPPSAAQDSLPTFLLAPTLASNDAPVLPLLVGGVALLVGGSLPGAARRSGRGRGPASLLPGAPLATNGKCGGDMASVEIEPDQVRTRLAAGEEIFFLDVREPDEVAQWAFPGAVNIPLGQLGERSGEIPTDRPIVVVCHSGMRSASATEALNHAGFNAQNLAGGAVAWIATDLADMG